MRCFCTWIVQNFLRQSVLVRNLLFSESHRGYPNLMNCPKQRIVGGESEFCRYLDKPMWKWDIWTWHRKSLFSCLYLLLDLFLISCAFPLAPWVCCLITIVSISYHQHLPSLCCLWDSVCVCVCVCVCVWLHCVACGILVPQLGIELTPPAVEAQNLKCCTTREAPEIVWFLNRCCPPDSKSVYQEFGFELVINT